jgi:hypothetical protein
MGKDVGFWVEGPGGGVVALFYAVDAEICGDPGCFLDLFLFADTQSAVKERARGFGITYPGLKWDRRREWITDDDVQAVVSSVSGAVWRRETDETDGASQYRDIKDWPPRAYV